MDLLQELFSTKVGGQFKTTVGISALTAGMAGRSLPLIAFGAVCVWVGLSTTRKLELLEQRGA